MENLVRLQLFSESVRRWATACPTRLNVCSTTCNLSVSQYFLSNKKKVQMLLNVEKNIHAGTRTVMRYDRRGRTGNRSVTNVRAKSINEDEWKKWPQWRS